VDEILSLEPDVVHFTGPHLWNVPLLRRLAEHGIPTIHTLHDLDPHKGRRFKTLIQIWNHLVVNAAGHILVHGESYRTRLFQRGVSPERVVYTPLLHLFLSYEQNLTWSISRRMTAASLLPMSRRFSSLAAWKPTKASTFS
jgi:hypothetical protein